MFSNFKKLTQIALAILVGSGAFAVMTYDASAQTTVVTFCYRGRTLMAPQPIADRYFAAGATPGACPMTPP